MYNICFGTQYRSRRSGAPWGYQGRKAVSRLVAKGMLYNTALYVFVWSIRNTYYAVPLAAMYSGCMRVYVGVYII